MVQQRCSAVGFHPRNFTGDAVVFQRLELAQNPFPIDLPQVTLNRLLCGLCSGSAELGDVQPSVNGAAYIGVGIYGTCHVDIDFVGIDRLIVYDSLPHIHFKFLGCRIDFDGDVVLTLRICLSGCFQHGRLYFFHQLCNIYVVFTSQQGECVKKTVIHFLRYASVG